MIQRGLRLGVKIAIDRAVALIGLLVLLPAILVLAITIRVALGSPVFFRQDRPGRRGRIFRLVKFRTMTDARDERGALLPDADRLTAVGRFLRATSLDEVPQLWNVLRGDLSLVGPRPLLPRYLPRYSAEQARRHDVLSGITGWAQVNGRNALTWEEKLALDVWYVDHWSLLLDAKILLLTAWTIVRRRGISHGQAATMHEFMGTKDESRDGT
jgi:lipopolysaccharide/colanic/teichoic acid biosynthesis glycosyltransferase